MSVKSVLVTGFEPFGGHVANVSGEVAKGLGLLEALHHPWSQEQFPVAVTVDVLSVDAEGARRTAKRLKNGEQYDAVLHLGLCERCEVPQIEVLARDRLEMRIPDNLGRQVRNTTVDGGGDRGAWIDPSIWPKEVFNTPFHLSQDAGSFICNETFFHTLKAMQQPSPTVLPTTCLFVHLPDATRLDVEASTTFAEKVLAFLLHPTPEPPVHVVAGYLPGRKGRHLVAKRAPREADAGCWEFPGGKIESGESWKQAIVRELREELAIEVTARHPLGTVVRTVGSTTFAVHLIMCEWSGEVDLQTLRVHEALTWVGADDLDRRWSGRDGEFHALVNGLSHNQVDASPSSSIARSSLMDRGT
jgi:mutator protein MutT